MAKKILIIAGGTGGHIFPGLTLASEFKNKGFEIYWLGTSVGLEQKLVAPSYPLFNISMRGVRGKNIWGKVITPYLLIKAIIEALLIIRKINPDIVLGMGGYVSGPGGIAAWLSGKPLIIHEQNSIAGYANRMLAKIASVALAGFPHSFPSSVAVKTIGNPIRNSILRLPPPKIRCQNRPTEKINILILGGSQGARALNEILPLSMKDFLLKDQLSIWHQTGKLDHEKVQQAYQNLQMEGKVEPFIDDMAAAYEWADLIICRSGALTVAEIAAVGVASILIPFPQAVDNHQYYNARYLEEVDAAFIIEQKDLSKEKVVGLLQLLMDDRKRLITMAENARKLAYPNAVQEAVNICLEYTIPRPASI